MFSHTSSFSLEDKGEQGSDIHLRGHRGHLQAPALQHKRGELSHERKVLLPDGDCRAPAGNEGRAVMLRDLPVSKAEGPEKVLDGLPDLGIIGALVGDGDGKFSCLPDAGLLLGVLREDGAHLEYPLGVLVAGVPAEHIHHAGKEPRPQDMVFLRDGVGELDRVEGGIHPGALVVLVAQVVGRHFLHAEADEQLGQLAFEGLDGRLPGDSGHLGDDFFEVLVAMRDGDVLADIYLVEDVRAVAGHKSLLPFEPEAHPPEKLLEFLFRQGKPEALVDVREIYDNLLGRKIRADDGLVGVRQLHAVYLPAHVRHRGDNHVEARVLQPIIEARALDEDVGRLPGDLPDLVGVDDGGHGKHLVIGIEEYGERLLAREQVAVLLPRGVLLQYLARVHPPAALKRPEDNVLRPLRGEADGRLYLLERVDADRHLPAVPPVSDVELLLDVDDLPDLLVIVPYAFHDG